MIFSFLVERDLKFLRSFGQSEGVLLKEEPAEDGEEEGGEEEEPEASRVHEEVEHFQRLSGGFSLLEDVDVGRRDQRIGMCDVHPLLPKKPIFLG